MEVVGILRSQFTTTKEKTWKILVQIGQIEGQNDLLTIILGRRSCHTWRWKIMIEMQITK